MGRLKVKQYLVRAGVLQNIDDALSGFGVDPSNVLGPMGIDNNWFEDGDRLVNLAFIANVIERCADYTRCPHFALRLAAVQDPAFLGGVGLLMRTSSTLREAILELGLYVHIHAQPVSWQVIEEDGAAQINVSIEMQGLTPNQRRLCIDLALAQCFQVMRVMTQNQVRITRVKRRCAQPDDTATYRRYFEAPIEYNEEIDTLIIPTELLDLPVSHSDAALHEIVRTQLQSADLYGKGSSLEKEVRAVIKLLLPGHQYGIDTVARCFGCDKRTLQRHLKEEGNTTFQAILDSVRFDLAKQYLRESNMSVTRIAYAVGYSDASNFSRVFKKQFQSSPKQWRLSQAPQNSSATKLTIRHYTDR